MICSGIPEAHLLVPAQLFHQGCVLLPWVLTLEVSIRLTLSFMLLNDNNIEQKI